MKNIINNCSNNTNNEINNNKSEVKTMRKITNNTINFDANALNSSIIASTISHAGNGYDGFLFGDDVNFEQLTAYCVLCEANHFEAPNNGIEGFARLAQVYYNTVEYRNFTGIGSVQQLREYDEVPEKLEVRLNGWRPEEYISTLGDTYSILPLNDFDLAVVRQYAVAFNEMQPESIRVSDDDIEAVLDDYRIVRDNDLYDLDDDDDFATDIKECVCKGAAREFDPAALNDEPYAVVLSYPCDGHIASRYNPDDLCFMVGDLIEYNRLNAFLLVCKLNGFHTPGCDDDGFARLAQVYYNTAPDKFGCVGVEKCGYYLNPECYEEAYHFELKGWDVNCYISEFGEVLPIKHLTNDDLDQIAAYAKQISSKQPEALRVSDDQIDAYIANAKLEG